MKENDIRPSNLMEEHHKYYLEDMANLQKRSSEFVSVSCPACDSNEYKKEFEKYGFNYDRCKKCETIFVNPRATVEILNDHYNTAVYYQYWAKYVFPASEEVRRKMLFAPRVDRVIELLEKSGKPMDLLVEVGAGFGIFCQELKSRNKFKKIIAIEPIPDLAEKCRSRGLEVIDTGIEEVSLGDECADVVASFEVIEHLFSPMDFLIKCSRIIKKGGLLVLSCPNGNGFDLSLLGEKSSSLDGEHFNYFNTSSIGILLTRCGFDVLETITPGKLDAEIARKTILNKEYDISGQPFLKEVLIDRWEELGESFQQYLADNKLSSHMWIVAEKRGVKAL